MAPSGFCTTEAEEKKTTFSAPHIGGQNHQYVFFSNTSQTKLTYWCHNEFWYFCYRQSIKTHHSLDLVTTQQDAFFRILIYIYIFFTPIIVQLRSTSTTGTPTTKGLGKKGPIWTWIIKNLALGNALITFLSKQSPIQSQFEQSLLTVQNVAQRTFSLLFPLLRLGRSAQI